MTRHPSSARARRRAGRRQRHSLPPLRRLLGLGLLLLVAAAATLAYVHNAYAERVYPGVTAGGEELGGLTRAEAHARLQAMVEAYLRRPLVLRYGDRVWRTTPQELGVRVDVDGLVEQVYASGREGGPLQRLLAQWQLLTAGRAFLYPLPHVDAEPQEALVAHIAAEIDRPVVNARLTIGDDGEALLTAGQTGLTVDREETLRRLRAVLADGSTEEVEIAVIERPPAVSEAELRQAKALVDAYLASPIVLRFGERTWTISRQEIARLLVLEGGGDAGGLRPRLDPAPIRQIAERIAAEIQQEPQDARLQFRNGRVTVLRPSRNGQSLDPEAVVRAVLEQAPTSNHTISLPVMITRPRIAAEDKDRLGIVEAVVRNHTSFPGASPPKIHNIKLAAERLNGYVIAPGEVFSFNRAVGPTTLDAGYQVGWGIVAVGAGSRTVPSVAGGICQVATTLFQAVFWAGYPIEQRRHHAYWIASYGQEPLGRKGLDATVDADSGLDFQFVNPTPYHILVQAAADETNVYVTLYSTRPTWQVMVEEPVITNVVPASRAMVYEDAPTLPLGRELQVEVAQDGFDVTLTRTVVGDGEPRVLRLRSHYKPSRNVTLRGTGGRVPTPTPTARASS